MLATLDSVVERIIRDYDPERIILFGSHAGEEPCEGGDIDLLIIKETDGKPLDRRIAIERLLADRSMPLDLLVFTPSEIRQMYSEGNPLIENIVEHGRVLYMRQSTGVWIAEAREEVESAAILFDHGKYRGACLHSQQCAEKLLKALILEKGRRPARTHDIVDLMHSVRSDGWAVELPVDDAVYLNSVYRGRYPTEEGLLPQGEPTDAEARRAVAIAQRLLAQVESLQRSL